MGGLLQPHRLRGSSPGSQASPKSDIARADFWYDYLGVPHPSAAVAEPDQHTDLSNDLGKAVGFISADVEATDHFVVVA